MTLGVITLQILYKDNDIIAVNKPCTVPVNEEGVKSLVSEYGPVFIVHRLDTPTTGILILARNQKSAGEISKSITSGDFKKTYLAVVEGDCPENGDLEDELFFDRRKNKSFAVSRARGGTKHASLSFSRLEKKENLSLVKINLKTGRTHQIRVQFASRKIPLFGDGKYGSRLNGNLALHCTEIEFPHPKKRTIVHVTCPPPTNETPWNIFDNFDVLAP